MLRLCTYTLKYVNDIQFIHKHCSEIRINIHNMIGIRNSFWVIQKCLLTCLCYIKDVNNNLQTVQKNRFNFNSGINRKSQLIIIFIHQLKRIYLLLHKDTIYFELKLNVSHITNISWF